MPLPRKLREVLLWNPHTLILRLELLVQQVQRDEQDVLTVLNPYLGFRDKLFISSLSPPSQPASRTRYVTVAICM